MIGIFVWKPGKIPEGKSKFGHAAMWIGGSSRQEYVSFWPGKEKGFLQWEGSKRVDNYEKDRATYGRDPWVTKVPIDSDGKPGLNVPRMFEKWDAIKTSGYNTKMQCSRVVLKLMVAGGARDFLYQSDSLLDDLYDLWAKNVVYAWSPDDVKDYAKRVVKGIALVRQRGDKKPR